MDAPVLDDQQDLINIYSERTQDVIRKTFRERWMIGTDGEREKEREIESGKSVPAARLDSDGE